MLSRSRAVIGILVAAIMAVAGCAGSPTQPSNFAAFSQSDLTVGTGGDAVTGKLLTVHYTGWFYNNSGTDKKGVQFETSRGGDPFQFILGAGQVISGWDLGTAGMRVGGLRRLIIPPSLAYGATRNGIIPPNATLVFEIELVAVEDAS